MLVMAIVTGMVAVAIVSLFASWFGGVSVMRSKQIKQAYVIRSADQISDWLSNYPMGIYELSGITESGGLSGVPSGYTDPYPSDCRAHFKQCLFKAAGVADQFRVQVSLVYLGTAFPSGKPVVQSILVWIPRATAGAIDPDPTSPADMSKVLVHASVPVASLQSAAVAETQTRIASAAHALQAGYGAWLHSQQDIQLNWYQPVGCGFNTTHQKGANPSLACTSNGWMPLKNFNLGEAAGWVGALQDAWGGPIEVCNVSTCGAIDSSPPYTMLIRATTPDGRVLQRTLVEPLSAAG